MKIRFSWHFFLPIPLKTVDWRKKMQDSFNFFNIGVEIRMKSWQITDCRFINQKQGVLRS